MRIPAKVHAFAKTWCRRFATVWVMLLLVRYALPAAQPWLSFAMYGVALVTGASYLTASLGGAKIDKLSLLVGAMWTVYAGIGFSAPLFGHHLP